MESLHLAKKQGLILTIVYNIHSAVLQPEQAYEHRPVTGAVTTPPWRK